MSKSIPLRFKSEIYRYILAFNEDKAGTWEQDMPERYTEFERYDNIDKDSKYKKKVKPYIGIGRDAQLIYAELYNKFIAGIIECDEVIKEAVKGAVKGANGGDIGVINAITDAIATAHSANNTFSIVSLILTQSGGLSSVNSEWTIGEGFLANASDPRGIMVGMFENALKDYPPQLIKHIVAKFTHFTKVVSSIIAKFIWRGIVKAINANVMLTVLDTVGCGDGFLDEIQSVVPEKTARVKGETADVDDADADADADDADASVNASADASASASINEMNAHLDAATGFDDEFI
jgi:hypothetical protein